MKLSSLAPAALALSAAFLFTSCDEKTPLDSEGTFPVDTEFSHKGRNYILENNVLIVEQRPDDYLIRTYYDFEAGRITDWRSDDVTHFSDVASHYLKNIYDLRNKVARATDQEEIHFPLADTSPEQQAESFIRSPVPSQ